MTKPYKLKYKVFLFERVKKKIKFFNTQTYPPRIRLTVGPRTVYLKSYFFDIMLQKKHQQDILYKKKQISIEDIIFHEEKLIKYIINKPSTSISLDLIKQEYSLFSYDILNRLDEEFKDFLIDFFHVENLPAFSLFIQNDGSSYTSEFILNNLEISLHPTVFSKLLEEAAKKGPPYIPLIKFFRKKIKSPLPIFAVFEWRAEYVLKDFNRFVKSEFPEYQANNPADYIEELLEKTVKLVVLKIPITNKVIS